MSTLCRITAKEAKAIATVPHVVGTLCEQIKKTAKTGAGGMFADGVVSDPVSVALQDLGFETSIMRDHRDNDREKTWIWWGN